jgi:hypothetical protein
MGEHPDAQTDDAGFEGLSCCGKESLGTLSCFNHDRKVDANLDLAPGQVRTKYHPWPENALDRGNQRVAASDTEYRDPLCPR